jgi:tryptophan synthase beta subunit
VIQQAIARVLDGRDLSRDDARAVMDEIMRGEATPAQIGGFTASDDEALAAFRRLAELEGMLPAFEPAHALARALDLDAETIVVGLSGRGDKDLAEVLAHEA